LWGGQNKRGREDKEPERERKKKKDVMTQAEEKKRELLLHCVAGYSIVLKLTGKKTL